MIDAILLTHAIATLAMVGVIWFVQVVHYPLMGAVGPASFPVYQRQHQQRTTAVVAPLMLLEAATALLLLVLRPPGVDALLVWSGAALVGALWISTFLWQMPCHARLAESFDALTHRALVRSNWLRTALWSFRGLLAVWMCLLAQT